MRPVTVDGVVHAARAVGPETWQNRGQDGDTQIAAHVLACDTDRFVGVLDTLVAPYDPESEGDHCAECDRIAGPAAERRKVHATLRAEGKPVSLHDLLDQPKWWRTADGEWLTIEHMGRGHATNAAAYLVRHARSLEFQYSLAETAFCTDAFDDVMHAFDVAQRERMRDVEAWVRSTPCWLALADRGGLLIQGGAS